jgi:hypothetical protein
MPSRSIAALTLLASLALTACARTADPVSCVGEVIRSDGRSGVAVGDVCSVDLAAETRAGLNCRVTIRCGERTLFGGARPGGYADCGVDGARYGSASDERPTSRDGDPAVSVDLAKSHARVTDDVAGYDVEIVLLR